MPHILDRLAAHRRAMQGILHCGLAKAHRGNPTASLRLERSYGAPVLLSGVASLVLSSTELSVIHQQYKSCIRQLLRLPITTPECFTMFFAGALPATAIVHLRTLNLLGMIGRLGPHGILDRLGRHSLLTACNKGSWFLATRRICQKYSLPDPLIVLQQPLPKARWKSLCKSQVVRWWECQFRGEAAGLTSLVNFNPHYFSLIKTHRTLSLAGSPHEVSKATTVMLMMSGRYITCHHTRHWDMSNTAGACKLCPSSPECPAPPGTLQHQLLLCPALQPAYASAARLWTEFLAARPLLQPVVAEYTLGSLESSLQFLLNPSALPSVIRAAQLLGQGVYSDCHYLSRTWCHSTHVLRLKLLKDRGFI